MGPFTHSFSHSSCVFEFLLTAQFWEEHRGKKVTVSALKLCFFYLLDKTHTHAYKPAVHKVPWKYGKKIAMKAGMFREIFK